MPIPQELLIELWYRALAAEIGIAVPSSDKLWLSKELYKTRKALNDDRLHNLTLQQPGKSDELWICHKAVEIPEE